MARLRTRSTLFYNDIFKFQLPDKHRFPMQKYELVRRKLQSDVAARGLTNIDFEVSPLASRSELASTHCIRYIDRFFDNELTYKENRSIGFPWSHEGVLRAASSVGGTVASMRRVCSSVSEHNDQNDDGVFVSGHIAGGTHHAFFDRGEGFCVFSDIAVAANLALRLYSDVIKRILIIDLDVHQGNGNSVLFNNAPQVFTFSMHCKQNYFSPKERSDLDIEVEEGADDETYLQLLAERLPSVFERANPDLVFYQAGVDGIYCDRLGKLKLTPDGLSKRNKMLRDAVYTHAKQQQKTGRLVVTMGGGYPRDLDSSSEGFKTVIQAHADCYLDCLDPPAA